MRILIGILYCIENELDRCIESIRMQDHKDFDYFVVSKMKNKAAHDFLYGKFMASAQDYDVFIKIDADMVLLRPTFFSEVIDALKQYPDKDHFHIGLWDFFTDRMIGALQVFRSNVRWKRNDEKIFVDVVVQSSRKTSFYNSTGPLSPAAIHCPDPGAFQAFHFGLHKAVKVLQTDADAKIAKVFEHAENAWQLFRRWRADGQDLRLLLAWHGFAWAVDRRAGSAQVDFDHPESQQACERLEVLGYDELEKLAVQHRLGRAARLPLPLWILYCAFCVYTAPIRWGDIGVLGKYLRRLIRKKQQPATARPMLPSATGSHRPDC